MSSINLQTILITGAAYENRVQLAFSLLSPRFILPIDRSDFLSSLASHPDIHILQPSPESIGIDEIRGLQQQLSRKPISANHQAALIPQSEKMTIEAQNAFLKTLEESPNSTIIILCAPSINHLLPTVISRCQTINIFQKDEILKTPKPALSAKNLLSFAFIEQITAAPHLSASRQKTLAWIEEQILVVRSFLIKNIANQSSPVSHHQSVINHSLFFLKNLLRTKTYIDANINPRLALENLLMNL